MQKILAFSENMNFKKNTADISFVQIMCQNQEICITKNLKHHRNYFWKNMLAKFPNPFLNSFHTYLTQEFQNIEKKLKSDQSFLIYRLNSTANPAYPAALFWPFWLCPPKLILMPSMWPKLFWSVQNGFGLTKLISTWP